MRMKATLKPNLRIVNGRPYPINNLEVIIVDYENHPIYGPRYKVEGHDEWFELNAFEVGSIDPLAFIPMKKKVITDE